MYRQDLISKLKQYRPSDSHEEESLSKIIKFVEENENCFERSLSIGHITGSAWLLNSQEDKALLTYHKKLNKWLQLGGHADGESDILKAALKEAREESGINDIIPLSEDIFDLDVHFIPPYKEDAGHYHYDVRFLLKVTRDDLYKISEESLKLGWFTFEELSQLKTDQSVLRLAKKWKNNFLRKV